MYLAHYTPWMSEDEDNCKVFGLITSRQSVYLYRSAHIQRQNILSGDHKFTRSQSSNSLESMKAKFALLSRRKGWQTLSPPSITETLAIHWHL